MCIIFFLKINTFLNFLYCIQLSFINPDKCTLSVVCFQTVVWTAINSVVSFWFWRVGVSLGPRRWAMCLLECSHTALYPAAPACPPVKVRTHLYSTSPSACLRVKQGEMHWWVWCLSAIQTYTYLWKLLYRLFYIHFKRSSNVKENRKISHTKNNLRKVLLKNNSSKNI